MTCLLTTATLASAATNLLTVAEETVQGGASANNDIDEATAGYLHVKYGASPFDVSRKAYFRFNLGEATFDSNASAIFTLHFTSNYQHRVQLWGLNQYAAISNGLTWNSAPANETNSNNLITNGGISASRIGADVLVPMSGTIPYSFTIGRLGDYVFSNQVTLVVSGVNDATNNAAGLRMQRGSATLAFSTATGTNYDVYLLGGQSNMDGRGLAPELTGSLLAWNQPQPDVQIHYANPGSSATFSFNPIYETGWRILTTGFSAPPGFSGALPSGDFGPELSFAKTMADTSPARQLALIKVTKGGVSLNADWSPAGGYMYKTFTNTVREALAALVAEGKRGTLRGMIWHQGESDTSGSAATNYQANMITLIDSVRRDLGVTNLPFVVGEIATNKSQLVRTAQYNLAQTIPYVGFASADGLQTYEGTHFITSDVLELGRRFAAGLEVPEPVIVWSRISNQDLILRCSGLAAAGCCLLTTTNLAVPTASWTVLASNIFDSAASCSFTNTISDNTRFYILRSD